MAAIDSEHRLILQIRVEIYITRFCVVMHTKTHLQDGKVWCRKSDMQRCSLSKLAWSTSDGSFDFMRVLLRYSQKRWDPKDSVAHYELSVHVLE